VLAPLQTALTTGRQAAEAMTQYLAGNFKALILQRESIGFRLVPARGCGDARSCMRANATPVVPVCGRLDLSRNVRQKPGRPRNTAGDVT